MKGGSCIVDTASITGLEGSKDLLDYSATKGAVPAFTKSLARITGEVLTLLGGGDDGAMRTRSMSQRHVRFRECIEHQVSRPAKLRDRVPRRGP